MIIYLTLIFFMLGLFAFAALNDFFKLKIPNYISVTIIALFALAYLVCQFIDFNPFQPLGNHLTAGGLLFIIMFGMFAFNLIGGGDAKLIPAAALWVGTEGLAYFVLVTILWGFPLALVALFFKNTTIGNKITIKISGHKYFTEGWIKALANGENVVPYGIAIAAGVITTFISFDYLP